MRSRAGWSRRWAPLLEAVRALSALLLLIGCAGELFAATLIAYVLLNLPKP